MPAYWIARVRVTDPETFRTYVEIASRVVPDFGGRYLARGGRYRQMEGREYERNAIVEFPDFESAEACYTSEAYAPALEAARRSCEWELVIVDA